MPYKQQHRARELNSEIKSFYKYCPVYDFSNLNKEYSLINLFEKQVTFSTRRNFNDLFDSKIDFIVPSNQKVKGLLQFLSGKEKIEFKRTYLGVNGPLVPAESCLD